MKVLMLVEDGDGQVIAALVLTEDHAHRFEALLTLTDCKAKADIVICGRRMHLKTALFLPSSCPLGI